MHFISIHESFDLELQGGAGITIAQALAPSYALLAINIKMPCKIAVPAAGHIAKLDRLASHSYIYVIMHIRGHLASYQNNRIKIT